MYCELFQFGIEYVTFSGISSSKEAGFIVHEYKNFCKKRKKNISVINVHFLSLLFQFLCSSLNYIGAKPGDHLVRLGFEYNGVDLRKFHHDNPERASHPKLIKGQNPNTNPFQDPYACIYTSLYH